MLNSSNSETSKVDLILFKDLFKASLKIFELTKRSHILILIGDTPSYLKPILELEREVHNLPLSGQAMGCFEQNTGKPVDIIDKFNILIPTQDQINGFFRFLDQSEMNKKFWIDHWENVVLIDRSMGKSIMGASNLINRYVGNIDDRNDCWNIKGAKPIKFINLTDNPKLNFSNKATNEISHKNIINYNPNLIIYLGTVQFQSIDKFMIEEAYPRYVPEYIPVFWTSPPYSPNYKTEYRDGLRNIDLIKKIVIYYKKYKENCTVLDNNSIKTLLKFRDLVLGLQNLDKHTKKRLKSLNITNNKTKICNRLAELFTDIDILDSL